MRLALGQFAATERWEENLESCRRILSSDAVQGSDLLVFPEGVMARFHSGPNRIREVAQPLSGPFISGLRKLSAAHPNCPTLVVGVHEPAPGEKVYNTLVVIRDGEIVTTYRKLHLYDAFHARESDNVLASDSDPITFDCGGWTVGLMTCYDLRFPELARLLALRGAELIVLPAAWVKGPLKERHWETLVSARALDNTLYMAGVGECGPKNIGQSMVADPLGMPILRLDETPGIGVVELSHERVEAARNALPVLQNRRFDVLSKPKPLPARSDQVTFAHRKETEELS